MKYLSTLAIVLGLGCTPPKKPSEEITLAPRDNVLAPVKAYPATLEQISGEVRAIEYAVVDGYRLRSDLIESCGKSTTEDVREQYMILSIRQRSGEVKRIAAPYDTRRDQVIRPQISLGLGIEINGLAYRAVPTGKTHESAIARTALRMIGTKYNAREVQVDGIVELL